MPRQTGFACSWRMAVSQVRRNQTCRSAAWMRVSQESGAPKGHPPLSISLVRRPLPRALRFFSKGVIATPADCRSRPPERPSAHPRKRSDTLPPGCRTPDAGRCSAALIPGRWGEDTAGWERGGIRGIDFSLTATNTPGVTPAQAGVHPGVVGCGTLRRCGHFGMGPAQGRGDIGGGVRAGDMGEGSGSIVPSPLQGEGWGEGFRVRVPAERLNPSPGAPRRPLPSGAR